jgi:beta-alanine--pyruvate transaminase
LGLVAGFDLRPVEGSPGLRAYQAMESGFHDHGIMLRISGDTIALSPPLIISRAQIDEIFSKRLPAVLDAIR